MTDPRHPKTPKEAPTESSGWELDRRDVLRGGAVATGVALLNACHQHLPAREAMADCGGVQTLVTALASDNLDVKAAAAGALLNCAATAGCGRLPEREEMCDQMRAAGLASVRARRLLRGESYYAFCGREPGSAGGEAGPDPVPEGGPPWPESDRN